MDQTLEVILGRSVREDFLTWQCRLRRVSSRRDGGRPSPGMRPRVTLENRASAAAAITVLIARHDPTVTMQALRHAVLKTHDPRQRYEQGLRLLSSDYYEEPKEFSGTMTAQFITDSSLAADLLAAGSCQLHFEEAHRRFRLTCAVGRLSEGEPSYELTYWHNRVFNPNPPATTWVLVFEPDWDRAAAESDR